METPFLVKAVENAYHCIKVLEKMSSSGKQQLTKNKVYLVYEISNGLFYVKDGLAGRLGWSPVRFKKLEFIDIWEIKRSGKLLPSQV